MQKGTIMDRKLIGEAVKREVRRNPAIGTWPALERVSGVARATLYRLRDGNPTITSATFARVEAALGWPSDTLGMVGKHDLDGLREIGAPAELLTWVARQINPPSTGANATKAV